MNKCDARKIAAIITNEQIHEMFNNAKKKITGWNKVSAVNKGITKGTAWNILAKNFNVGGTNHILAKTNMVREFGDYLSTELILKKGSKSNSSKTPAHQDPIF